MVSRSKYINLLIKLLIAGFLLFVLYNQLKEYNGQSGLKEEIIDRFASGNILWLVGFVILMPLNWVLEAKKWKSVFGAIPFTQAFKTILAGISLAIITPNRVGEYGGRLLTISPEKNWKSIVATLVGSVGQNLATIFFGITGLIFLSKRFNYVDVSFIPIIFTAALFFFLGLYVYFNIDVLAVVVKKFGLQKYLQKFSKYFQEIRRIEKSTLLTVLILSALRYMLYVTQYYLVIRFFNIDVDPLAALQGITSILLIQSSLPLPPFISILARGEISLLIWGLFGINELIILSMTFLIWSINLLFPALLGYIVILRTNIVETLGYGK